MESGELITEGARDVVPSFVGEVTVFEKSSDKIELPFDDIFSEYPASARTMDVESDPDIATSGKTATLFSLARMAERSTCELLVLGTKLFNMSEVVPNNGDM